MPFDEITNYEWRMEGEEPSLGCPYESTSEDGDGGNLDKVDKAV